MTLLTIGWSAWNGKDLNWDQLNYHFYAAYALLHDRLGQDFMAAGVAGYLNPLAFVPFYEMVMHGWPSLLIASVLAGFHALNIVLVYFIARRVLDRAGEANWASALLATVLAFLSPIYLSEVGTSFADISTSVFVLLGLWLALDAGRAGPWWRNGALLAGVAVGFAGGLKLTNAIYGPALALMVLALPLPGRSRALAFAWVAIGGLCGLIAAHGYWSWQLWTHFKNPFFPLFNAIFHSPDYPPISHRPERFLLESWGEVLALPFRMMIPRSWIYIETVAPDLRFAAALIAAVGAAVLLAARGLRRLKASGASRSHGEARGTQDLRPAFAVFFVVALALWLQTSGNGRYGIALSILCGPMLAVVLSAGLPAPAGRVVLALVTILQAIHVGVAGEVRWNWLRGRGWEGTWYEMSVPDDLQRKPYLYLQIGAMSNSYIAPFVDSASAFMNISTIDFDGRDGRLGRELLRRYAGRTRVVDGGPTLWDNEKARRAWLAYDNSHLSRIGLAVDANDCEAISSAGDGYEWEPSGKGKGYDRVNTMRRRMLSCRLVPAADVSNGDKAERETIKTLMQTVVAWCPKLFKPDYLVVDRTPDGWQSLFADTEVTLTVGPKDRILVSGGGAYGDISLGTVEEWRRQGPPVQCADIRRRPRTSLDVE